MLGLSQQGADGVGKELGAAAGGTRRGVELLEIDEQLIDDSEWGRGLETGSDQLGLQRGGGMLGLSQQGDAFALPGPQQEHGMRLSATLSSHAGPTSASVPPPSTPFPLAVPMGLLMRALEVQEEQAMLLAPRGLGRGRSCLVSGWTCAGRRAPLRLAQRACTGFRKKLWRCAL